MSEDRSNHKCPECKGRGVDFRGKGRDMEYRYCSRIHDDGHAPTPAEATQRVKDVLRSARPSGRFG